jgi:hypothetical protein
MLNMRALAIEVTLDTMANTTQLDTVLAVL